MAALLLDREFIAEIRLIEEASGRHDVLAGLIRVLERNVTGFGDVFCDLVARGDTAGAARTAHTLKGACRQLGAQALGDLFADIEHCIEGGDHGAAKQKFDDGAGLIVRSLEALKRA